MSFQELCENGSFLERGNGSEEGWVAFPELYSNPLNKLQRIVFGVLFFFLSVVAILGNGFALLTVYKRKLQILYKFCVVSQCIGDLLMAIFVGINSLNNFAQDTIAWIFGDFMCACIPYVTTLCALLSSMIMTCIAFDRYHGVFRLNAKWDPKFSTAFFTIGCLWLIAAGATLPTFLIYYQIPACLVDPVSRTSEYSHLCVINKIINSQYFTGIFSLIFLPLLIAFIWLYVVIAQVIWSKKKVMGSQQLSVSTTTLDTNTDSQNGGEDRNKPSKASHIKKKVRTFKIILIIMGTFIICRLPQWIFIVLTSYPGHSATSEFWWIFKYVLSALSLANTSINPFIYSFLNEMMNIACGLKNLKLRNIRKNLFSIRK